MTVGRVVGGGGGRPSPLLGRNVRTFPSRIIDNPFFKNLNFKGRSPPLSKTYLRSCKPLGNSIQKKQL